MLAFKKKLKNFKIIAIFNQKKDTLDYVIYSSDLKF